LTRSTGSLSSSFSLSSSSSSTGYAGPEFHKEIWLKLTDQEKERVLLAIPRDHAKTTLAKLIVVWYWLFTPHRFAVYLSNTAPIAKGACRDIMAYLENPNFIEVFGKVRIHQVSQGQGLWIFDLPLQAANEALYASRDWPRPADARNQHR
jgi:hypothetical protein